MHSLMMMMIVHICLLLLAVQPWSKTRFASAVDPLSDEFIVNINSAQSSWKAGRNFKKNTPIAFIKRLLGVSSDGGKRLEMKRHTLAAGERIPGTFDARTHWPNCPTIGEIQDQGSCGSCWAIASAAAMSDRYCIHYRNNSVFRYSAQDLLSCCASCGRGCEGGQADQAWRYWVDKGVVSGGPYGSGQGCKPFEIPPCAHHVSTGDRPACGEDYRTPTCVKSCQPGYKGKYKQDRHSGRSAYRVEGEDQIKIEIMRNGPVTSELTVYEDFLTYKTGVYRHNSGGKLGSHTVRVLGWGVENSDPYWLVANSWNTDWGGLGGYFKILRGSEECGIENHVSAGLPK